MNTRQLQHVQSLALQLHIGSWSGDKRRMEISVSTTGAILTVGSSLVLPHSGS